MMLKIIYFYRDVYKIIQQKKQSPFHANIYKCVFSLRVIFLFLLYLFACLFIHSLNICLLSTFNVAGKVLVPKDKNEVGTQG